MSAFGSLPELLIALPAMLVLVTAIAAAFAFIMHHFSPRVKFLECLFMAPGIGLSASAWLALIIKSFPFMRKGVAPETVWLTAIVQAAIASVYWRSVLSKLKNNPEISEDLRRHRSSLIMLGVMAVWWAYMSWIHYLLPRGSEHLTGGSVYADLPFHLNLTTSFLDGINEMAHVFSSLMSSFYAGVTLAYPFMPDFYLSVLYAGGMTLRWALVSTSAILLSSLFALIYIFNFRWSDSVRVGALSVWLTLFAGGIGGFYYVSDKPDWYTIDNLTNSVFMHGPDHVLYWVRGMSAMWFSLPAHILFPQRTVQHAYPLAVSALLLIYNGTSGKPAPELKSTESSTEPQIAGGSDEEGELIQGKKYETEIVQRKNNLQTGGRSRTYVAATTSRLNEDQVIAGSAAAGSTAASGGAPSTIIKPTKPNIPFSHKSQRNLFFFAGFVTALIPLMQPHSYVSIGVVILIVAIVQVVVLTVQTLCCSGARADGSWFSETKREGAPDFRRDVIETIIEWACFGGGARARGVPPFAKHFLHRVTFGVGSRGNGFVRYSPSWAEEGKGETPQTMWWKALGFFVPLYIVSFFLLTSRTQRAFYLGCAAL